MFYLNLYLPFSCTEVHKLNNVFDFSVKDTSCIIEYKIIDLVINLHSCIIRINTKHG